MKRRIYVIAGSYIGLRGTQIRVDSEGIMAEVLLDGRLRPRHIVLEHLADARKPGRPKGSGGRPPRTTQRCTRCKNVKDKHEFYPGSHVCKLCNPSEVRWYAWKRLIRREGLAAFNKRLEAVEKRAREMRDLINSYAVDT
jgi:hypothetical protein